MKVTDNQIAFIAKQRNLDPHQVRKALVAEFGAEPTYAQVDKKIKWLIAEWGRPSAEMGPNRFD